MLEFLFQIIIYPIYFLLEIIFHFLYIDLNPNICPVIFLISYVISMACLPLYINAEKLQKEEEEIQKKLAPKVNSIKKNFKGDEKHLLLQTFYRQNNYHPVMGLRLSFSLLLQIPFFLAAYIFFHNLTILNGMSLWGISDLSKPDGLLNIGNFTVNILPIIMTVINILAGFIYAKDKSFKKNIQLYIMSLIFLVLLYNSPSALVLYWTFNNVFSLLKNIGLKYLSCDKFLNFSILIFLIFTYYYLVYNLYFSASIFVGILLLVIIPLFVKFDVAKYLPKSKDCLELYFISNASLWLLFGFLIPTNVISTSPGEFMFPTIHTTPFDIIQYPMLRAFGLFIVWGGFIYLFSSKPLRKILSFVSIFLLSFGVINMMAVSLPVANLLCTLAFDNVNIFELDFNTINPPFTYFYAAGLISIFTILVWMFLKKISSLQKFFTAVILAFIIIGSINSYQIFKVVKKYEKNFKLRTEIYNKTFHFSKDKKNVLIIFLDRAISSYFPLIIKERPELENAYDGFTYYPNTVSFAPYTILGYPPILGGYEYDLEEMIKKNGNVMEKTNEAISVLPRIFRENGWLSTVTDTPGFDWGYDFLDMDELYGKWGVNYKNLRGRLGSDYFQNDASNEAIEYDKELARRNMLYFGIMQTLPGNGRIKIYDYGRYFNLNNKEYKSPGIDENYAELYFLPKFTDFDSKENSFMVINNDLPHQPTLLTPPDYTLTEETPKDAKWLVDDYDSIIHYHVNAAALILVGKYLEFLKENGVYDNTRIIIVSDHGRGIKNPYFNKFQNEMTIKFNPLLIVKDFNSRGEIKTVNDFMTNADVPYISTLKLIQNPKNPFTGKEISINKKDKGVYIKYDSRWHPRNYTSVTNPIGSQDKIHFVKDNIFDRKNWVLDIKSIPKT